MSHMRLRETSSVKTLPSVQRLHREVRPSLSLGKLVHWSQELQVLPDIFVVARDVDDLRLGCWCHYSV